MKPFDPARTRQVRARAHEVSARPPEARGPASAPAAEPVSGEAPTVRPARKPATRATASGPATAGQASGSTSLPAPSSKAASSKATSSKGSSSKGSASRSTAGKASAGKSPAGKSSAGKSSAGKAPAGKAPAGKSSAGKTPASSPGRGLGRGKGPGLSRRAALGLAGEPRRSKADEAYLAIRNAIMDGSLAPGTALDKPAICRDLRLSRFPVTAAIARLAFEHLVDVEPQRGSFVSRIAARDARELMLVRRGIEVELAGEAAQLFDDEAVAALKRILRYQQAALAAGDFQDFHRLDHALHDQIIADLGFGRAGEILEGIRLRVERARRILLPVPGRMGRTFQEHAAIVDAIAHRDAAAARSAMREHLQRVLDEFDVLARERPDLFAP